MHSQKWYDILDEEGVWRVGECLFLDQKGMKHIAIDGFHSNYTALFCQHSDKILPIRSKTKGLTVPLNKKPLRQVLSALQLQNIIGRLNLYLLKPNLLQFQPKLIRSSIRTQFLIIVDKIVCTPFEIIREIKMLDLQINKFFINLLNLYLRILDFSKVYMTLLMNSDQNNKNQAAMQLYKSVYQQTIMVTLILGIHPHSTTLYDHKLNINLKAAGLLDYVIMSEGVSTFRNFIKNSTAYIKGMKNKQTTLLDMNISVGIIQLFIQFCQKGKNQLLEGENKTKTSVMVDDIITHLKHLAEGSEEVLEKLNKNLSLISKIQALYFKFKPNKQCNLRKYLTPKEQIIPPTNLVKQVKSEKIQNEQKINIKYQIQSKQKISELEERLKKLESLLVSKQGINISNKSIIEGQLPATLYSGQSSPYSNFPTQNLGEELFLTSVEWALQCGNVDTAKKLVKWRKSVLQIGRIAGWDVALLVGCKTLKKAQITTQDIIEANYEILMKTYGK